MVWVSQAGEQRKGQQARGFSTFQQGLGWSCCSHRRAVGLGMLGLHPVQPEALPVLVSGVGVLFLSCTLRAAILPLGIVVIV